MLLKSNEKRVVSVKCWTVVFAEADCLLEGDAEGMLDGKMHFPASNNFSLYKEGCLKQPFVGFNYIGCTWHIFNITI